MSVLDSIQVVYWCCLQMSVIRVETDWVGVFLTILTLLFVIIISRSQRLIVCLANVNLSSTATSVSRCSSNHNMTFWSEILPDSFYP